MLDEPPAIDLPQYYYLPARDRRALVILVCVLIVSPAIAFAVWRWLLGVRPDEMIRLVAFVGVISAALLSLLRARIRVDQDGIARRGFVGWRTTPWSEILARPAQMLCVRQGPWTGASRRIRRLYTAPRWLEPDDMLSLHQLLTPSGTRTHLPELPRRFQMTLFGPSILELDAMGLRLEGSTGVQTWSWAEVEFVKVRKERATTPAIDGIRIELTDGAKFSNSSPTIVCDCPCQCRPDFLLQQFLRSVLSDDQLLIYAQRGEPASVTEAQYRLEMTESGLKTGRTCARCYGIVVAGLLGFGLAAHNELSLQIGLQLAAYGLFFGPAAWGLFRQQREVRDMLQAYLDARIGSKPRQPLTSLVR